MPAVTGPQDVSEPDDLYSLPTEQFTAARDRLKTRLIAEGQDELAASVAKLRKPSVVAWALNRVSRDHPEAVERLVASHRQLRAAKSADLLEEASKERRRAISELEQLAETKLTADGHAVSGQTRNRIAGTLLAVATDPESEADLVAGRLMREVEPSGAGWGDTELAPSPTQQPNDRPSAAVQRARALADRLGKQADSADRQVEMAQRALLEAKRLAKETRARADRAHAEAEEEAAKMRRG